MYLQAVGDSFVYGGEELLVLNGTVAAADFADHGPVGDVERSEQAGHTVATVVVGTPFRHAGHHRQDGGGAVQSLDLAVGSDQGAVSAFRLARFPGPPAEPDVPVSEHPALHRIMSPVYAAVPSVWLGHGEGMVL